MFRIIALLTLLAFSGFTQANPAVMKILVVNTQGGRISNSSAVLTRNDTHACVLTGKHITAYSQIPGAKFFIEHSGERHEVAIRWQHVNTDIAGACFVNKPPGLPEPARRGAPVETTLGYAWGNPVDGDPTLGKTVFRSIEVYIASTNTNLNLSKVATNKRAQLWRRGAPSPTFSFSGKGLIRGVINHADDQMKPLGGLSGGGLFDAEGALIGIVAAQDIGTSALYAVPLDDVPDWLFGG